MSDDSRFSVSVARADARRQADQARDQVRYAVAVLARARRNLDSPRAREARAAADWRSDRALIASARQYLERLGDRMAAVCGTVPDRWTGTERLAGESWQASRSLWHDRYGRGVRGFYFVL